MPARHHLAQSCLRRNIDGSGCKRTTRNIDRDCGRHKVPTSQVVSKTVPADILRDTVQVCVSVSVLEADDGLGYYAHCDDCGWVGRVAFGGGDWDAAAHDKLQHLADAAQRAQPMPFNPELTIIKENTKSISATGCQSAIKGFIYAITKARSILREQMTPWDLIDSGIKATDIPLEDIDARARPHDPWLFSDDCERVLESMATIEEPTPIDVMNWAAYFAMPPRKFKDDPLGPGDSLGLRLVMPSYSPVDLEQPHRLLQTWGQHKSLWDELDAN